MNQTERNKRFIIRYIHALNNAQDKLQALSRYSADPLLVDHTCFLEQAFPGYQIKIDEVTAEANRVVVRAHFVGQHTGTANGIIPSGKRFEVPYVVGFQVEQEQIVSYWMITDGLELFLQATNLFTP